MDGMGADDFFVLLVEMEKQYSNDSSKIEVLAYTYFSHSK